MQNRGGDAVCPEQPSWYLQLVMTFTLVRNEPADGWNKGPPGSSDIPYQYRRATLTSLAALRSTAWLDMICFGTLSSKAAGTRTRNPILLFLFDGVLLLRLAVRTFVALLFQLPPRRIRFEPEIIPLKGIVHKQPRSCNP